MALRFRQFGDRNYQHIFCPKEEFIQGDDKGNQEKFPELYKLVEALDGEDISQIVKFRVEENFGGKGAILTIDKKNVLSRNEIRYLLHITTEGQVKYGTDSGKPEIWVCHRLAIEENFVRREGLASVVEMFRGDGFKEVLLRTLNDIRANKIEEFRERWGSEHPVPPAKIIAIEEMVIKLGGEVKKWARDKSEKFYENACIAAEIKKTGNNAGLDVPEEEIAWHVDKQPNYREKISVAKLEGNNVERCK